MLFCIYSIRNLTNNTESYSLHVTQPPDTLWILRVSLQPCLIIGMCSSCTSQVLCIISIRSATHHVISTRCRSLGIYCSIFYVLVSILGIPVLAIFHHVAQHVLQSKGVRCHLRGFLRAILAVVGIDGIAVYVDCIHSKNLVPESFVAIPAGHQRGETAPNVGDLSTSRVPASVPTFINSLPNNTRALCFTSPASRKT